MRVTRLEIFGFKSFVERFSLNFDHNLIGVVGPNGCGKSNIVDALRWVLGETHAKQLRGSEFEDLIFNGSDSRRALGMAEVSLTIQPGAGWTEHLNRTEDELASILSEQDDLTEASEALLAQSSASEGAAEETLGEITPEVSQAAVPVNGNGHASEVAQKTASRPVVHSPLLGIPGLFQAAEIQLTRRLYRSGESEYFINRLPCRLRDMVDLYRIIGLGARGLSIVQQGQIGQLISKKPIERRELLEEAAGISGFRAKLESAQRKLERTSQNMERIRDIVTEVEKQVRVLKRQAHRARTRNELKAALESAELSLFNIRCARLVIQQEEVAKQKSLSGEELDQAQAKVSEVDARERELRVELDEFDTELYQLRLRRDEAFQSLQREQEQRQALERELVRCESAIQNFEQQKIELSERDGVVQSEIENHQRELEELKLKAEQLRAEKQLSDMRLSEVRTQVQERIAEIEQQTSAALNVPVESAFADRISELRQEIAVLESAGQRITELEVQLKDQRKAISALESKKQERLIKKTALASERESLQRQVKTLAQHVQNSLEQSQSAESNLLDAHSAVLLSGIRVQPELERAVAAALGERGNFLVVDDVEELGRRYAQSSANRGKSKSRIGVVRGVIRSDGKSCIELTDADIEVAPSAVSLLDRLELDPSIKGAAEALLGNVVVVNSLEEGLRLQSNVRHQDLIAVTTTGEVVTRWGWYTTQGEVASYSFARRIEELEQQEIQVAQEIDTFSAQIDGEKANLEGLEQALLAEKKSREQMVQAEREVARLLSEERAEQRSRQDQVRQEELRRREEALKVEREVQQATSQLAALLGNADLACTYAEKQLRKLEGDKTSMLKRKEDLTRLLEQRLENSRGLEQQLVELSAGSASVSIQESLEELEQAIKTIESKRNQQALAVGEVLQELSEFRRTCEEIRSRHSRYDLSLEKCELELKMLSEDTQRHYGDLVQVPTREQVDKLLAEITEDIGEHVSGLQEEASKLRQRLEREGEVDSESIQRFEEEQERLTALQSQYADLDLACRTLEKSIRRLKELSRNRFMETFADVSTKFEELVPRLFGGGAGKMELINPEDPLTSGVEISVRPPGKRPSNMELLSGGEKALVATAVLIAMFLHRPSPICVLDEVDAPLDDANLDRFLSLVKEISERTQFLIITHNKASMSAADRLVGITMQESGVSRALSVTLGEAEAQLEQLVGNA